MENTQQDAMAYLETEEMQQLIKLHMERYKIDRAQAIKNLCSQYATAQGEYGIPPYTNENSAEHYIISQFFNSVDKYTR